MDEGGQDRRGRELAPARTGSRIGRRRVSLVYCCAMVQPHPHAGATHKIIAREDGAFEVEVALPGARAPVTITCLRTRVEAKRWIDRHQAAIAGGSPGEDFLPAAGNSAAVSY